MRYILKVYLPMYVIPLIFLFGIIKNKDIVNTNAKRIKRNLIVGVKSLVLYEVA